MIGWKIHHEWRCLFPIEYGNFPMSKEFSFVYLGFLEVSFFWDFKKNGFKICLVQEFCCRSYRQIWEDFWWCRGIFLISSKHPVHETTVDGRTPAPVEVGSWNPMIYKVLYISGGAGFLPSTVLSNGYQQLLGIQWCWWHQRHSWGPGHQGLFEDGFLAGRWVWEWRIV